MVMLDNGSHVKCNGCGEEIHVGRYMQLDWLPVKSTKGKDLDFCPDCLGSGKAVVHLEHSND